MRAAAVFADAVLAAEDRAAVFAAAALVAAVFAAAVRAVALLAVVALLLAAPDFAAAAFAAAVVLAADVLAAVVLAVVVFAVRGVLGADDETVRAAVEDVSGSITTSADGAARSAAACVVERADAGRAPLAERVPVGAFFAGDRVPAAGRFAGVFLAIEPFAAAAGAFSGVVAGLWESSTWSVRSSGEEVTVLRYQPAGTSQRSRRQLDAVFCDLRDLCS